MLVPPACPSVRLAMLLSRRLAALGVVLALVAGAPRPAGAQSAASVRRAVRNLLGYDDVRARARADLRRWGNGALPHLEQLADEARGDAMPVVAAIALVGTPEARDLFVEVFASGAPEARETALTHLFVLVEEPVWQEHLRGDDRFAPALVAFMDAESWLVRFQAIHVASLIGGAGARTLFELLLDDEVPEVREAAAEALAVLVGTEVGEPRPSTISFPLEREDPGLVRRLFQLPGAGWMTPGTSYVEWFDGRPVLLQGHARSISVFEGTSKRTLRRSVPSMVHDAIALRDAAGDRQLVVLAADGAPANAAGLLISYDREWTERWRWRSHGAGIVAISPVHGAEGAIGVAVAQDGREPVVLLDLDGRPTVSIPRSGLEALGAHPALPGRLITCGGAVEVWDARGSLVRGAARSVEESKRASEERVAHGAAPSVSVQPLYATHAVPFPSGRGDLAVIAAGAASGDVAMIARYDEDLEVVWTASATAPVRSLGMVEPERGERLFVAVLETGELLVFSESGVLRHRARIRGMRRLDSIYGLRAGRMKDRDGFLVGLGSRTLVFGIRAPAVEEPERVPVALEPTRDLAAWGVRPAGPRFVALDEAAPGAWTLPPPAPDAAGSVRFGVLAVGVDGSHRVPLVVEELEGGRARVILDVDGDGDFGRGTVVGERQGALDLELAYPGDVREPISITWTYSVAFARELGDSRLRYDRTSMRVGELRVDGTGYPIALQDPAGMAVHDRRDSVVVLVDLDRDGRFGDDEHFRGDGSFPVAGEHRAVAEITPAGDRLVVRRARQGIVAGHIADAETGAPIAGARVSLGAGLDDVTEEDGEYGIVAPEGTYSSLTVSAEGYVTLYLDYLVPRIEVVDRNFVNRDAELERPTGERKGSLRLEDLDSYHFLSGRWYQRTEGDFYVRLADGRSTFFANNPHQRGLVDLGVVEGDPPLTEIEPPGTGYERFGVPVTPGHTYVARAKEGEEGHIVFRVTGLERDRWTDIDYQYR